MSSRVLDAAITEPVRPGMGFGGDPVGWVETYLAAVGDRADVHGGAHQT